MASFALHLKSQPHKHSHTLLKSTTFSHLYSSSSSNNNNNDDDKDASFSAFFTDIKSQLKQNQPRQQSPFQSFNPKQHFPSSVGAGRDGHGGGDSPLNPSPLTSSLTDIKSILNRQQPPQSTGFGSIFSSLGSSSTSKSSPNEEEIKRNLSEYRRRSSPGFPPLGGERKTEGIPFQSIRESLTQLTNTAGGKGRGKPNFMSFNNSINMPNFFKAQPTMPDGGGVSNVFGGSDLPLKVFGKELNEKDKGKEDESGEDELWMNSYTPDALGKKLRDLRPKVKEKEGEDGNWFSLSELHERLKKVKESDDKAADADADAAAAMNRHVLANVRKSFLTIKHVGKSEANMRPLLGFDILAPGPPTYMLSPPKEHLVEKYYHPDNLSAEEKLKLELEKVRNEFKMHESDCGSTRVQIAQLTTEILHLSSVLHKKDKHSRRGLLAKVQQRKKLLKYLRRTDWESYCFVLSKLGLRDNPDYKN